MSEKPLPLDMSAIVAKWLRGGGVLRSEWTALIGEVFRLREQVKALREYVDWLDRYTTMDEGEARSRIPADVLEVRQQLRAAIGRREDGTWADE